MNTYIKSTRDGRRVEVIGRSICLDGRPEADALLAVIAHPRWRDIVAAAPEATHLAGRITLTVDEAETAQRALDAARASFDGSARGVAERSRQAVNRMLMNRGDE